MADVNSVEGSNGGDSVPSSLVLSQRTEYHAELCSVGQLVLARREKEPGPAHDGGYHTGLHVSIGTHGQCHRLCQ